MFFVLNLKEQMKTSLWLLPALMGATSVIFAGIVLYTEMQPFSHSSLYYLGDINTDTLTVTISTLLAAIVTVFGFLLPMKFSILTRASAQFGPMVLVTYRSALLPKLYIGMVLATTVYLMTLLIALNYFQEYIVPSLSVLCGFILIITSIFSIPALFDHFARLMEPTYLASMIANDLESIVANEEKNQIENDSLSLAPKQDRSVLDPERYSFSIKAKEGGYIRSIDVRGLIKSAAENNLLLAAPVRSGDFILEGNDILLVKSAAELTEAVQNDLLSFFSVGKNRIALKDFEFKLDELVFIVLRALSPGVTDLSTAIQGINYIGICCNSILNYPFNSGIHKDEAENVRLYTKEFDYSGFIDQAFTVIIHNAKSQPMVMQHLLNIIKDLVQNSCSSQRTKVLLHIADRVLQAVEKGSASEVYEKMRRTNEAIKALVSSLQNSSINSHSEPSG